MGVLDQMTRGITERKATKAGPKLTPVGTEVAGVTPSADRLPNDVGVFMSNERLAEHRASLVQFIEDATAIVAGIDDMLGGPPEQAKASVNDAVEAEKVANKQADAKAKARAAKAAKPKAAEPKDEPFDERLARLKQEAEASVYGTALPDVSVDIEEPVDDGWQCPEHGNQDIKELVSRKGRNYRACGLCSEFEK